MTEKLITDRLKLTPLTVADKDWVENLYGDKDVTAGFGRDAFSHSELLDKMDQLLNTWQKNGFSQFLVIEKVSGEVTGLGGIRPTGKAGVGEIGYVFRPSWWGKGIASEAVQAWVHWGLDVLNLDVIIADGVENPASIRVLEKAGFTAIGGEGKLKNLRLFRDR